MAYQKGDILQGRRRDFHEAYHYIVYLGESSTGAFVGVILTTSDEWPNNVPLVKDFFRTADENGHPYKVQYMNSHFMSVMLDKPDEWGPYKKVGQITSEGIAFIESRLPGMHAITYHEYDLALRRL